MTRRESWLELRRFVHVDVEREESPGEALERWLRPWTAEGAMRVRNVHLKDAATMLCVAEALVDCTVRKVLPLSPHYRRRAGGSTDLESLPPLVDAASRQAARACLVGLRMRGGLALGSAVMALQCVETLAAARSTDDAVDAWRRLLAPGGPLYMAVRRTEHAGASAAAIGEVLMAATNELATTCGGSPAPDPAKRPREW